MATLTVQVVRGDSEPTLSTVGATGDVCVLDPKVKLKISNASTSATSEVTVTPAGPFVAGEAAKVYPIGTSTAVVVETWDYPASKGSTGLGTVTATYGTTNLTVAAFTVVGG